MMPLNEQYVQQSFQNDYQLVDGRRMHEEAGNRFAVPPDFLKKYVRPGFFVELRILSPRFESHPDASEKCTCSRCSEEAQQPVLSHQHPETLMRTPAPQFPARGWGEDFWVQVTQRDGAFFEAIVDNHLVESRLHGLDFGDTVVFHEDQILEIHPVHRKEMLMEMSTADLRQLAAWLQHRPK